MEECKHAELDRKYGSCIINNQPTFKLRINSFRGSFGSEKEVFTLDKCGKSLQQFQKFEFK